MRVKKLKCLKCNRSFLASRSDTKWYSEKCRTKERAENAKFETPNIPKSNIPGITYNRFRSRWEIRIIEDKKQKYVGSFKKLQKAIEFNEEIRNCA